MASNNWKADIKIIHKRNERGTDKIKLIDRAIYWLKLAETERKEVKGGGKREKRRREIIFEDITRAKLKRKKVAAMLNFLAMNISASRSPAANISRTDSPGVTTEEL